MAFRERAGKYDQTIVKLYDPGNGLPAKIKIVQMAYLKNSAVEVETNVIADPNLPSRKGEVNDEKLENNVVRARTKIFDLAYCNPWQYFFTGTLDPDKFNRSDLDKVMKTFSAWVRNLNQRKGYDLRYLIIPELHSDGRSWHLHGFLMGIPDDKVKIFKVGDTMGKAIANKVKRGESVFNWPDYAEKFGYVSLEAIRSHEAVAKYITKYITKELSRSVTELGAHMYYRSKRLNEPEKVLQGSFTGYIKPDYVGDYCSVSFKDYSAELMQYLCDNIFDASTYGFCKNESRPFNDEFRIKPGFREIIIDDDDIPGGWK